MDKEIVVRLGIDFSDISKGMNQVEKTVTGGAKGIGGAFKNATSGVGRFVSGLGKIAGAVGVFKLVDSGFNLIKGSMDNAINRFDTLNNAQKVFENIGFGAEETARMMDSLTKSLDGLPTASNDAIQGIQQISMANNDIEEAGKLFEHLNYAVLATGGSQEEVNRAVRMYSRALDKGQMSGVEFNALQETMGTTMNTVADKMGLTSAELREGLANGTISMDEFGEVLHDVAENGHGDFASLEQQARDMTDGIGTAMTNFGNRVAEGIRSGLIIPLNEALEQNGLPTIADMINFASSTIRDSLKSLAPFIEDLVSKFADLIDVVKDIDFKGIIQDLGAFLDKWSPLIAGVLSGVTAFKAIMAVVEPVESVFNKVKDSAETLHTGFLILKDDGIKELGKGIIGLIGGFNPLTLKIAAIAVVIATVVAVGVLLYKNWDTIKEKAQALGQKIVDVWNSIKQWTSETWNSIKEYLINLWEPFGEFFSGIWDGIKAIFLKVWEPIKELWKSAVEFFTDLWGDSVNSFSEIWDRIKEIVLNIWEPIKDIWIDVVMFFIDIWGDITNFFSELWEDMKELAMELWEPIQELWGEIVEYFIDIWGDISEFFGELWEGIKELALVIWEDVVRQWEDIVENLIVTWNILSEFFSVLWGIIKEVTLELWNSIKDVLFTVWESIVAVAEPIFHTIVELIGVAWEVIKGLTLAVWEVIKSSLITIWEAIKTLAVPMFEGIMNIIKTVWEVIKTLTTTVWNVIKGVIMTIWKLIQGDIDGALKSIMGIISSVWNGIKALTTIVWNGIKSYLSSVWDFIKAIITTATNIIKSVTTTSWNAIKAVTDVVWNGIRSVISSVWSGIQSVVTSSANGVRNIITSVWNGIRSVTTTVWNAIKNAITRPIESARNIVRNTINTIKGFMNFSWSFPKPRMPKFTIKGKFSVKPPSVPKLGLSWFASGGIATGPSVVGIGEAGDEAILPLSNKSKMKPFAQAVSNMMGTGTTQKDSGDSKETIITGNNFIIREEADIKRVAEELYRLEKRDR